MYFLTHQIYDRAVGLCEYTFVGAVVVFAEVKYTVYLSREDVNINIGASAILAIILDVNVAFMFDGESVESGEWGVGVPVELFGIPIGCDQCKRITDRRSDPY